MRLGWFVPLPGPFNLGGTLWRSGRHRDRRRQVWHGTLTDGWQCRHDHHREDTAQACAQREQRRRAT